jgi:DNA-binding transcriptional regulator YdaS (Cro superfamily)
MAPHEVISFFGTQVAASKALGISQPSIAMWVEVGIVPEVRQYQIELATNGQLRADLPALRNNAKSSAN